MYGDDKKAEPAQAFFENLQVLEEEGNIRLVDDLIQSPFDSQQERCDSMVKSFRGNVDNALFIMPTQMDAEYARQTGIDRNHAIHIRIDRPHVLGKVSELPHDIESIEAYQEMTRGINWFLG